VSGAGDAPLELHRPDGIHADFAALLEEDVLSRGAGHGDRQSQTGVELIGYVDPLM